MVGNKMLKVRKSDLQIHSPRDPQYKGWDIAKKPLEVWCDELIKLCLKKDLSVIAITDHHDLTAAKILKQTLEEKNLTDSIWLFPGMEITLDTRLQFMLYFERNKIPDQEKLLTAIGVRPESVPSLKDELKLPAVEGTRRTAQQLYKDIEFLMNGKNPFLLLPVVSSGSDGIPGNKSGREFYREESWVIGGVVRGETDHDRHALGGKTKEWGTRAITSSILHTSDQRGDPGNNKATKGAFNPHLGDEPLVTYLKLSEPTIESLRQALISGEGKRVFYSMPQTPNTYIKMFSVEGSNQLHGALTEKKATFFFSPELNCFIGGRGTGKSITLSALARAIGVDYALRREDNSQDTISRHFSLFKPGSVFDPASVKITVFLRKNEVPLRIDYLVENGYDMYRLYGIDEDGTPKLLQERNKPFLDYLDPFFSFQNQLSSLTDLKKYRESLIGLITAPRSKEREALSEQIKNDRSLYSEIVRKKAQKLEYERQLQTLEASKAVLTKEIKQLSAIAGQELKADELELIENQQMLVDTLSHLSRMKSDLECELKEFENSSERLIGTIEEKEVELTKVTDSKYSNKHLAALADSLANLQEKVIGYADKIKVAVNEFPAKNKVEIEEASKLLKVKINEAKAVAGKTEKSKSAQAKLREKNRLLSETNASIKAANRMITEIEKFLIQKGSEAKLHADIIKKVKEKSKLLVEGAGGITEDPNIRLSIKVTPAGDSSGFVNQHLAAIATRHACYTERRYWPSLIRYADNHESPALLWTELMNELQRGNPSDAPTWVGLGLGIFSPTAINNLMTKIPQEVRDELTVAQVEDRIELLYQTKEGKEIPFSQASAGEQAVELLRLSLKESEGPIIIDQPESDLDNRYIVDHFINELHSVRKQHQIIFATHNANVVVQGDADQIYVMNTKATEEVADECCCISCEGTIDQPEVKSQIETILEGGREAFKKREAKYLGKIHT